MESKEYIKLKAEIEELSSSVKQQGECIQKIYHAVVGDEKFGQEGLVNLVRKHENWIDKQKFMWAKIWGGIAVGTTLITFALKYLI